MAFTLPKLPFEIDALEPYISQKTLEFHYGKHHKNYVDTLNKLVVGTPYEKQTLEEVVLESAGMDQKIYNNSAQAWNHDFQWKCLTAPGLKPSGAFTNAVKASFGSIEDFKTEFNTKGKELFGSGWAWLVKDKEGKLKISPLSNAENPMIAGDVPLLTADVWEHAYYLDYQNERIKYLENFWSIVNWDFVEQNFERSTDSILKGRAARNYVHDPGQGAQ